MFTFSFDGDYFFDRSAWSDQWYAYTHPQKEPFAHGNFTVDSCKFTSHCEDGRNLSIGQIEEIEQRLDTHRTEMVLEQFEVYKNCPAHYREIPASSSDFNDLFSRMRNGGKWDPRFSFAWDKLTRRNPAYRLERKFVRDVIDLAADLSRDEWVDELRESCEDTWTYDIAPYANENETFDSYFAETVDSIYLPTEPTKHLYKLRRVHAIDSLPNLYLFCHSDDTHFHYNDLGDVVVPVFLPPHSGWMPYYIL